jgi:hypothetical protein
MAETNTLAYYQMGLITALKCLLNDTQSWQGMSLFVPTNNRLYFISFYPFLQDPMLQNLLRS